MLVCWSMKVNPYLPPTSPDTHPIFLRDLSAEERKRQICEGKTTAGPFTVFMYKHPIAFFGILAFVAVTMVFISGYMICTK